MVTIAANVDVSKVKVKEDVSRVLFDQDFGFGHHLCHYQVFSMMYSMNSLIYTFKNLLIWLSQGLMKLISEFWEGKVSNGECVDIQYNKDLMSQQGEYFQKWIVTHKENVIIKLFTRSLLNSGPKVEKLHPISENPFVPLDCTSGGMICIILKFMLPVLAVCM